VFAPLPSRELNWARAEHETPYGTASIAWRLYGDMVTVDVLVPASSQARVQLPDGSAPLAVDAGRHRVTCRLPQEAVTGRPVEFVPA
jgi:alpha-L-rhamnosidase